MPKLMSIELIWQPEPPKGLLLRVEQGNTKVQWTRGMKRRILFS